MFGFDAVTILKMFLYSILTYGFFIFLHMPKIEFWACLAMFGLFFIFSDDFVGNIVISFRWGVKIIAGNLVGILQDCRQFFVSLLGVYWDL